MDPYKNFLFFVLGFIRFIYKQASPGFELTIDRQLQAEMDSMVSLSVLQTSHL